MDSEYEALMAELGTTKKTGPLGTPLTSGAKPGQSLTESLGSETANINRVNIHVNIYYLLMLLLTPFSLMHLHQLLLLDIRVAKISNTDHKPDEADEHKADSSLQINSINNDSSNNRLDISTTNRLHPILISVGSGSTNGSGTNGSSTNGGSDGTTGWNGTATAGTTTVDHGCKFNGECKRTIRHECNDDDGNGMKVIIIFIREND